jgi:hypothetical protein
VAAHIYQHVTRVIRHNTKAQCTASSKTSEFPEFCVAHISIIHKRREGVPADGACDTILLCGRQCMLASSKHQDGSNENHTAGRYTFPGTAVMNKEHACIWPRWQQSAAKVKIALQDDGMFILLPCSDCAAPCQLAAQCATPVAHADSAALASAPQAPSGRHFHRVCAARLVQSRPDSVMRGCRRAQSRPSGSCRHYAATPTTRLLMLCQSQRHMLQCPTQA